MRRLRGEKGDSVNFRLAFRTTGVVRERSEYVIATRNSGRWSGLWTWSVIGDSETRSSFSGPSLRWSGFRGFAVSVKDELRTAGPRGNQPSCLPSCFNFPDGDDLTTATAVTSEAPNPPNDDPLPSSELRLDSSPRRYPVPPLPTHKGKLGLGGLLVVGLLRSEDGRRENVLGCLMSKEGRLSDPVCGPAQLHPPRTSGPRQYPAIISPQMGP